MATYKVMFNRKKFRTLLSGFGPIFFHKNKSRAETTQNNEKRLLYFSLRFPTRIHFSVSKMQIPKSLHPTVQYFRSKGFGVKETVRRDSVENVTFWI